MQRRHREGPLHAVELQAQLHHSQLRVVRSSKSQHSFQEKRKKRDSRQEIETRTATPSGCHEIRGQARARTRGCEESAHGKRLLVASVSTPGRERASPGQNKTPGHKTGPHAHTHGMNRNPTPAQRRRDFLRMHGRLQAQTAIVAGLGFVCGSRPKTVEEIGQRRKKERAKAGTIYFEVLLTIIRLICSRHTQQSVVP